METGKSAHRHTADGPYKVKGDQHLSTDTLQKGGKLSNDNLARVWQRVCE